MTKNKKPFPQDMNPEEPLMRFVDHDGNVIETDDNGNFPDKFSNDPNIEGFYNCIDAANGFFERAWWKGDTEIVEIRLYNDSTKGYYWTANRIDIFDNNRFGKAQKALEDMSGILRDVRPLKKSNLKFGVIHF